MRKSIFKFREQPLSVLFLKREVATHAAGGAAKHEDALSGGAVTLSVIDVCHNFGGQIRAIVGPLFHVEQTFYVFEIIVIVGLEGEGVFNMFSLIFLIIHEAGVEMIEIAVFVFVKAMRIDFGKPPLPLLFIEDILLNLVLREIDPLHDHVLQIGAFRVVERAFAIENNRVSIVARIERVVLPVFLHYR